MLPLRQMRRNGMSQCPGTLCQQSILNITLKYAEPDQVPEYSQMFSSVQFSHSVVSDSLQSHELQHARPPCPSPTPGIHSDSHPLSQWCHPAISSSVVPYSSCPQSLRPPITVILGNQNRFSRRKMKMYLFNFSFIQLHSFTKTTCSLIHLIIPPCTHPYNKYLLSTYYVSGVLLDLN